MHQSGGGLGERLLPAAFSMPFSERKSTGLYRFVLGTQAFLPPNAQLCLLLIAGASSTLLVLEIHIQQILVAL
jgi:hypothetical protein